MRWVLSYDISRGTSRARVAALLAMWGDRVQKSVFECTLDTEELAEVLLRVDEIIDHRTDSFAGYRQCSSCSDARILVGQADGYQEEHYWVV